MEIVTCTRVACTQIFYHCRELYAEKVFENKWEKDSPSLGGCPFKWHVYHGVNRREDFKTGWIKYSEPELIELSNKEINVFLNK